MVYSPELLPRPAAAPPAFHLLAKPSGPACNLDCAYCFFLDKEALYPGSKFRMSEEVLERYLRQVIEAHEADEVNVAWQGGEPTLMGLDFYRRALELAEKYRRPGMTLVHTMKIMAGLLRRGREAKEVMEILEKTFANVKRHDPCPCGSGRKFNRCHGAALVYQPSDRDPSFQ